jgi:hypothetical protein
MMRAEAQEMREKYKEAFSDYKAAVKLGYPAAQRGYQGMIKMIEQSGEGAWVRQNR